MTQPDLDKVISRWTRLGIFFGASPARRSPDLERLLLDTARLVPANPRLFYLAVTWLSRYSDFVARHRLKHLVECDLEPDVQPGLGVLLALAIKHGASRELRIAADICAPAEVPRPLFNVQRRSRELEQLARERASDEGLGWNLWVPDQPPKLDALRPTHWLIANNPSYLERIVRKGDLRTPMPRKRYNDLREKMSSQRRQFNEASARRVLARQTISADAPTPKGPPADRYADLVAALSPRPLHDEHDYEDAVEMIGRLAGYDLNRDQEDYLEALTVFVERYEAEHEQTQVDTRGVSGLDVLRSLLEEHNMSGADLSRLLGASRSLGPMLLRGERSLTVHHARLLGERFKVDPGMFIR